MAKNKQDEKKNLADLNIPEGKKLNGLMKNGKLILKDGEITPDDLKKVSGGEIYGITISTPYVGK